MPVRERKEVQDVLWTALAESARVARRTTALRGSWEEEATVKAGENFEDRVLDELSVIGDITARPMFGGHGLYWRATIFGILFGDRLYLKVDEQSKGDFVSRGMGPFRPNERQTLNSYYEVPPDVLTEPEALLSWAREAIRAGQFS
jgi:DNA transformation protein